MPSKATLSQWLNPAQNVPAVIAILLMVDSLHFVFARLLMPYLPGGTSALYVLAVATVEIAIFLAARRAIRFEVFRQNLPFFLTIGLLVALSTTFNYVAVAYIDPGTASLLAQMSTIFAMAFSLIWLRERLNRLEVTGALVAIIGVFVINFQPGDYLRLGSLLVLGSSFLYALHAAIVKRHGGELEFRNFFFWRVASTTGFLLIFTVARGQLVWPEPQAWIILIVAGTVDVVISRVLYYLALRRLRMSVHTVILTLSPAITILWSLALFGELPTLQGLVGGAAVISGVAVITAGRARARKTLPARQIGE
ncbi:MAG: DMT family transporter [Chloroflexota bacterium]|jgi:drug/metabolite transporter (DMT)-like permease